jgi:hypothetical protein
MTNDQQDTELREKITNEIDKFSLIVLPMSKYNSEHRDKSVDAIMSLIKQNRERAILYELYTVKNILEADASNGYRDHGVPIAFLTERIALQGKDEGKTE